MATEHVDGFRLDRIGQLLNTAYPELLRTPGLDGRCALRPFSPGVLVAQRGTPPPRGRAPSSRGAHGAHSPPHAPWRAPRAPEPDRTRTPHAGTGPGPPGWAPPPTGQRAGPGPAGRGARPARRHPGRTGCCARPERPARAGCPRADCPPGRWTAFCAPCCPPCSATRTSPPPAAARTWRCAASPGAGCACRRAAPPRCRSCSAATLPPGTVRTGRVGDRRVVRPSVTTEEHGEIGCRAAAGRHRRPRRRRAAAGPAGAGLPPGDGRSTTRRPPPRRPTPALLLDARPARGPVAHTAVMSAVDPSARPGRPDADLLDGARATPPPEADSTARSARICRGCTASRPPTGSCWPCTTTPRPCPRCPRRTTCAARCGCWRACTCAGTTATPAPCRARLYSGRRAAVGDPRRPGRHRSRTTADGLRLHDRRRTERRTAPRTGAALSPKRRAIRSR